KTPLPSRSAVKGAYERKRLLLMVVEILQIPVLLSNGIFHSIQKLQTWPQGGQVANRAKVWQREQLNRRLQKEKEAKWNVRDARPPLRLKKSRFRLTRLPFHDPLRFHRKLSGDLCGRQACTLAGPREDAGINKLGLAHGELGISKRAVAS
ncbi:hypothetical protein PSYJA_25875, partial [Pseudomonas syringae pv. japonica str. M301072]